jgi:hypothetical protein
MPRRVEFRDRYQKWCEDWVEGYGEWSRGKPSPTWSEGSFVGEALCLEEFRDIGEARTG